MAKIRNFAAINGALCKGTQVPLFVEKCKNN